MHIAKASVVTEELQLAIQRLIPQLTTNKTAPSRDELSALLTSETSTLLIARASHDGSEIVGMLTLIVYRVPTGTRSIVEDVVVDERLRRHGIGKGLMLYAIGLARELGASSLSLTSNPSREAANQLYLSIGFKKRETNAYYLELK